MRCVFYGSYVQLNRIGLDTRRKEKEFVNKEDENE